MASFPRHTVLNKITGEVYTITKQIGLGAYGKVLFGKELHSQKLVALKVMDQELSEYAAYEVHNLLQLRKLNPDKCNLVHFYGSFFYKNFIYIAMEMLDKSLHDYVYEKNAKRLNLSEIRVILKQTMVALNALKSIGLVHTDIKPDNIMLCNQSEQPFRVKLIDFGLALNESEIRPGVAMQPTGYRAPEVILGLPANGAVDMWSVGCVGALLYTYNHLYPIWCEYEEMKLIVQIQGQPPDHMLENGMYTGSFFWKIANGNRDHHTWRLKTLAEYNETHTADHITHTGKSSRYICLDDMMDDHPAPHTAMEWEDNLAFMDLIHRMLCLDPAERLVPSEALEHDYITMRHFPEDAAEHPYVKSSHRLMEVCTPRDPGEASDNTEPMSGPSARVEPQEKQAKPGGKNKQPCPTEPEDREEEEEEEEEVKVKTLMRKIRNFCSRKRRTGNKTKTSSPGEETSPSKFEATNQSNTGGNNHIKPRAGNKNVTSDSDAKDEGLVRVKTRTTLLKRIGNFFCRKTNQSNPGEPNTSTSGVNQIISGCDVGNESFGCDNIRESLKRIENFFSRRFSSRPGNQTNTFNPGEEPNTSTGGFRIAENLVTVKTRKDLRRTRLVL